MKIKTGLAIIGAGVALNAAAANLGETKKNTEKEVKNTIQYTPSKSQVSTKDLTELFIKPAKNKEKIDDIISSRSKLNSDITDIKVDEKLKYTTFKYKKKYNIKYEPEIKKGEVGMDIISIIDSINKKEYKMQIKSSLFTNNLKPKNPKEEIHKKNLTERLDHATNTFNAIIEKTLDENVILNSDEPIVFKGNTVYFTAEKKIGKKEDFEDCFWKINYQKAKKEGNIEIAEDYKFVEIKNADDYYDNAML